MNEEKEKGGRELDGRSRRPVRYRTNCLEKLNHQALHFQSPIQLQLLYLPIPEIPSMCLGGTGAGAWILVPRSASSPAPNAPPLLLPVGVACSWPGGRWYAVSEASNVSATGLYAPRGYCGKGDTTPPAAEVECCSSKSLGSSSDEDEA